MFVKDFKTLYRKKASLIIEILLICIFAPLLWGGSWKVNELVSGLNDEFSNNPNISFAPEIDRKHPTKIFFQKKGIIDHTQFSNFWTLLSSKCGNITRVEMNENPDVIITIKSLSTLPPKFDYELMLAKNDKIPYHNEPYVVPNIFGSDGEATNLGEPFSISQEAMTAQFCADLAFALMTNPNTKLDEKFFVRTVPAPNPTEFSNTMFFFVLFISIVFPLCMLLPTMITAAEVCAEKETGIHRYMIVMGLPRYIFYLSHLICAFIKMYLFIFLAGGALIVFYPKVGIYLFILMFLLGHIFLGIVFMFSTVFKKTLFVILSTFGFLILLFGIHSFVTKYIDVYDSSLATVLCCLNPMSAFSFGINHLSVMLSYKQPLQFFASWNYYLPFCGFKYAAEKDIIEDELPEVRCKIVPADTPSELMESSMEDEKGDFPAYFETDASSKTPDIEVSKLVKKWSNDEIAIKNVSFRAYRDQVTALLGHNGAGKSTVFGILTGSVRPTAGIVRIKGEPPTAIGEESNVGFCPQWNPLFPYLTVEEHLAFYGDVKTGESVPPEEIDAVLKMIGLFEDRTLRGSQLSGGMKRKLCVGIALIGESQVLLLDEPTAGIDPVARRTMLEIIEKAKEGRTILLTTHYMDEADYLSDRIIIMAKGEIVCNGSSDFLKARFATGFILTVDLNISSESVEGVKPNYNQAAADILNVAIKHCDGARMDGPISRQFNMVLPYGSQRKFPKLFKEFENRKDILKIESFDVRENNLEQVFIKVTDHADSAKEEEIHGKVEEFIQKKSNRITSNVCLFASQFLGLVIRKFRYTLRHYIQTSLPIFVIFILLIVLILNATKSTSNTKTRSDFYQGIESTDISTYSKKIKIYLGSLNGDGFTIGKLLRHVRNLPNVEMDQQILNEKQIQNSAFFTHISQSFYGIPPFAFGIENFHDSNTIYYRHVFPNGVPLALNLLGNSRFTVGKPITTTISIQQRDIEYSGDKKPQDYDLPMILISVFVFPLVFAFPVLLYNVEIHEGTLHLYQRTSMSILTYWLSAFVSDFVISMIPILITTILIFAFGIYDVGCLFGYWISVILISFSFLSQAFVVSNVFKTATWSIVFLFCWNFILYGIAVAIETIISMFLDVSFISKIIFPTYSLFSIFRKFNEKCHTSVGIMEPFELCKTNNDSCTSLGTDFIIVISSTVFYTLLLLLITYWRKIKNLFSLIPFPCCRPSELPAIQEDSDVLEERQKIEEKGMEKFAICTKNLRKDYSSSKIAVRDLSIGIKAGECFGLLGANGAGKSTTFNMLTAIVQPTYGTAVVNGVNIEDKPPFGFVPQKDAILGDLTVSETLMLFARLNGILNAGEVIECLMECLKLSHKRDNLAKNCSGGELRRLSLGVALVTNSDVIMMDEPTAGVDPRTRRNVWELLIALRANGTSQVLTSHSMEECEALCTRIGFINKGQLVGIGTSQYLKHRYGNTYLLTITMHGPDEPLAARLNIGVQKEFRGTAIVTNGTFPTLSWTVPKTDTPLSEMYEKLIEFVDRQPQPEPSKSAIKDFALVGTSLDEVFIAMTRNHIVDIPEINKNTA
uniref:ABC transporter domain-containing protein n=1 Tax=Panagrolaimus sp. ES5 TaxID=591445 RepID=A0AC34GZS3_9BILA